MTAATIVLLYLGLMLAALGVAALAFRELHRAERAAWREELVGEVAEHEERR